MKVAHPTYNHTRDNYICALLMKDEGNNVFSVFDELISKEEKEAFLNQKAFVVWMTGLSGSGKTTLAKFLERKLLENGYFSKLLDGDLVLMDFAPDYGYYTSDIGRMWPVNGKFKPWQRELCQWILIYHKEIISRIEPGRTPKEIMDEVEELLMPKINNTKFSKEIYKKAVSKMIKTGGGVFSHTVGMAVHDVGHYREAPLKEGQVFAVDPQLRIKEEGLYMRIEDTGVVTIDGFENFTALAPMELKDIEKIIGSK